MLLSIKWASEMEILKGIDLRLKVLRIRFYIEVDISHIWYLNELDLHIMIISLNLNGMLIDNPMSTYSTEKCWIRIHDQCPPYENFLYTKCDQEEFFHTNDWCYNSKSFECSKSNQANIFSIFIYATMVRTFNIHQEIKNKFWIWSDFN